MSLAIAHLLDAQDRDHPPPLASTKSPLASATAEDDKGDPQETSTAARNQENLQPLEQHLPQEKTPPSSCSTPPNDTPPEPLIGKKIEKSFEGHGSFIGTVTRYNFTGGLYEVTYSDGDTEEYTPEVLQSLITTEACAAAADSRRPRVKHTSDEKDILSTFGLARAKPIELASDPIVRLFDDHVLYYLLVENWTVEPNNVGRVFFPPGINRRNGRLRIDYFDAVRQVLYYLKQRPRLLRERCDPKVLSVMEELLTKNLPHKNIRSARTYSDTSELREAMLKRDYPTEMEDYQGIKRARASSIATQSYGQTHFIRDDKNRLDFPRQFPEMKRISWAYSSGPMQQSQPIYSRSSFRPTVPPQRCIDTRVPTSQRLPSIMHASQSSRRLPAPEYYQDTRESPDGYPSQRENSDSRNTRRNMGVSMRDSYVGPRRPMYENAASLPPADRSPYRYPDVSVPRSYYQSSHNNTVLGNLRSQARYHRTSGLDQSYYATEALSRPSYSATEVPTAPTRMTIHH